MTTQERAYTSPIWYTPSAVEHFRFGSDSEVNRFHLDFRCWGKSGRNQHENGHCVSSGRRGVPLVRLDRRDAAGE